MTWVHELYAGGYFKSRAMVNQPAAVYTVLSQGITRTGKYSLVFIEYKAEDQEKNRREIQYKCRKRDSENPKKYNDHH